jgi:hypothetical protein
LAIARSRNERGQECRSWFRKRPGLIARAMQHAQKLCANRASISSMNDSARGKLSRAM